MKGLSIRQPWVYAIYQLGKDIENRDWPTNIRGRVALHASATIAWYDFHAAADIIYRQCKPSVIIPNRDKYDLGVIVGTVEIVDCVQKSDSPWFFGEYGFVLESPRLLKTPIPFKGMLGFWDVPKSIEPLLMADWEILVKSWDGTLADEAIST